MVSSFQKYAYSLYGSDMIPLHHLHRSTATEALVRQRQTLTPSHAVVRSVPFPLAPCCTGLPGKEWPPLGSAPWA